MLFATAATAQVISLTHTSSNLNLRSGRSKHYPVRRVIPRGAEIDVHSCEADWCYTSWAGHRGYVSHDYLRHHVVEVIPAIEHVAHVHYHTIY